MQSATLSPSTLTAASPLQATRNSLMTDIFRKHQIVACQHQIRNKKEAQLSTRSLVNNLNACYILMLHTLETKILVIFSQQNTPQRLNRKAKLNETIMMFSVNMGILLF